MKNTWITTGKTVGLLLCYLGACLLPLLGHAQTDSNPPAGSTQAGRTQAGSTQSTAYVLEIRDAIDPRMTRYVDLGLEAARTAEADYLLISMNTYGGAVNDADAIRTALLEFEKPVFVFINKNAASAGALISIACNKIYMAPGANIGAATVVNGQDGSQAPDKYQSYMRSMMRATAEARGRDPRIAEAMVDAELEVAGISEAGQVLTFTVSEAMQHGYCEGTALSLEEVLQAEGLEDVKLVRHNPGPVEGIISLFLNPAVSSVLILIMLGGIYFELQTPGVGFPVAAAVMAALLYFIPYYLTGLAANWEVLLFVGGLVLLALEAFVIPGFGVAGILGVLVTVTSLGLMMLANDWLDFSLIPTDDILEATASVLVGLAGGVVLIAVGLYHLPRSAFFERVALMGAFRRDQGYKGDFATTENLVGKLGTAFTTLKPGGRVEIDGQIYEATTRSGLVDPGTPVRVLAQRGSLLNVKPAPNIEPQPPAEA